MLQHPLSSSHCSVQILTPPLTPSHSAARPAAQIKGTVLLMPNGTDRITSAALQQLQSEKSVEDEEIKALLAVGAVHAGIALCMLGALRSCATWACAARSACQHAGH